MLHGNVCLTVGARVERNERDGDQPDAAGPGAGWGGPGSRTGSGCRYLTRSPFEVRSFPPVCRAHAPDRPPLHRAQVLRAFLDRTFDRTHLGPRGQKGQAHHNRSFLTASRSFLTVRERLQEQQYESVYRNFLTTESVYRNFLTAREHLQEQQRHSFP